MDEYGYIQIVDRFKDVIKSGGEWIVSLEVERLISLHTGVREAAVIGILDEVWGERPLALIVPGPEAEVSAEGLRAHLGTFVTAGAITPAAIPDNFVFVEEIVKTSVGKHDKKLLRKLVSKNTKSESETNSQKKNPRLAIRGDALPMQPTTSAEYCW